MPRPIPVAIRQQIVQRHQAGVPLKTIAQELQRPYESVRKVWRLYRREGRIEPNYAACGPSGVRAEPRVYRAARFLKHGHRRWGAPLICQIIRQKWPDAVVPHPRSLQRWFQQWGLTPPRRQSSGQARLGRGKAPHNVWEMDSREGIQLASQERVTWLLISDEASGAVLNGAVSPYGTGQPTRGGRSAGASARLFHPLGATESAARGQW